MGAAAGVLAIPLLFLLGTLASAPRWPWSAIVLTLVLLLLPGMPPGLLFGAVVGSLWGNAAIQWSQLALVQLLNGAVYSISWVAIRGRGPRAKEFRGAVVLLWLLWLCVAVYGGLTEFGDRSVP